MTLLDGWRPWRARRGAAATRGSEGAAVTAATRLAADVGGAGEAGVQFGPGVPPPPAPLDRSGQPRTFGYRVGWNIPSLPGEGRPLPFDTLRQLADTYDLLRKAIELRKDEVCSLQFDIVARDPDRRRAKQVVREQQAKIAAIRAFFAFPDGRETWQSWLRRLLEDYFVVDAVTIWKRRTLGGALHSLRLIDGTTIKPLLSVQGDRPEPPDPAYQQYLYGVARESFTADELIYAPKNRRNQTPYGFSPVEQFLWHINEALRYGRFRLDWFTDGTLPEGVAVAPPGTTPQQLRELRDWWDGVMAGDTRALHKLQWVPAGTTFHAFKTFEFSADFARWLVTLTCSALDVTPQELGFDPEHNGLGGRGYAEEQSTILKRKSTGPLVRWLCDEILNPLIWREFGAPELAASFRDLGDAEDRLQAMQARDLAIRNGSVSIDQAVEEDGGEPPGIGRLFVFGNSVLFEPDLVQGTLQGTDGDAPRPVAGAEPETVGSDGAVSTTTPEGHAPARSGEAVAGAAERSDGDATLAEVQRFLRFARERQRSGKWRDFTSAAIPAATLAALNKAAQAGAGAEALRALAGLVSAP